MADDNKKKHTLSLVEVPTKWTPGKYTEADKADVAHIINWLNKGQEFEPGFENQRTQTKLSKASGVNDSTLNTILRGVYPSPVRKHVDKLLDVIAREDLRLKETLGHNPFVETSVYIAVNAACHRAHVYRNFAVISCYVGTGKTWALRHYIENHPNAILIESHPDMNTLVLLREIVEKTGAVVRKSHKWARGTKSDLMEAVIKKLKGSDTLLILDEAEKVTTQTLEYVRRISDLAEIGVVLSGTEYLRPLVRDPRGRFGQISSRVGFWPPVIRAITYTDSCKIVDAAIGRQVTLDEDLKKAFYKVSDGSARVLARTLIPAVHDYGIRKGKEITPRLIQTIGSDLLGYNATGA